MVKLVPKTFMQSSKIPSSKGSMCPVHTLIMNKGGQISVDNQYTPVRMSWATLKVADEGSSGRAKFQQL